MKRCIKCNGMIFEEVDKSVTTGVNDKMCNCPTPSDKTELKLEDVKLLPCPMCGGKPIDEWAFAQWCIKCEDCELQIYRGGDMKSFHAIVEAWNRRSEPSKPSETPMSKEDAMKSQEPQWCKECICYHPENIHVAPIGGLPSSPTDKCREEYEKHIKANSFGEATVLNVWNAAWQASRKECQEELEAYMRAFKGMAKVAGDNETQIKKLESSHHPRIRELQTENDRLKQELEESQKRYDYLMDRHVEAEIAYESLQAELEAKDEKLKIIQDASQIHSMHSFCDIYNAATAALHIDQSGVKKEEDGILNTPSATPVSSHVGTKEDKAVLIAKILEKNELISELSKTVSKLCDEVNHRWISVKDEMPNQGEKVIYYTDDQRYWIGYFRANIEFPWFPQGIATHWMPLPEPPKPREDTTSGKAPLNSQKSSTASTAISTEEGKK